MVLDVEMFSSWSHFGYCGNLYCTCIVLKDFAMYLRFFFFPKIVYSTSVGFVGRASKLIALPSVKSTRT